MDNGQLTITIKKTSKIKNLITNLLAESKERKIKRAQNRVEKNQKKLDSLLENSDSQNG